VLGGNFHTDLATATQLEQQDGRLLATLWAIGYAGLCSSFFNLDGCVTYSIHTYIKARPTERVLTWTCCTRTRCVGSLRCRPPSWWSCSSPGSETGREPGSPALWSGRSFDAPSSRAKSTYQPRENITTLHGEVQKIYTHTISHSILFLSISASQSNASVLERVPSSTRRKYEICQFMHGSIAKQQAMANISQGSLATWDFTATLLSTLKTTEF